MVALYFSANHRHVRSLSLFTLKLCISPRLSFKFHVVVEVWSGLSTKRVSRFKEKMMFWLKIPGFVAANKLEKCPDVSLKNTRFCRLKWEADGGLALGSRTSGCHAATPAPHPPPPTRNSAHLKHPLRYSCQLHRIHSPVTYWYWNILKSLKWP